jgi:hypothetical protein
MGFEAVRPASVRPGSTRPAPVRPRLEARATTRSWDGQIGPALRRLMVTPTFAAGLGVVVAAGLAVSMTTRTVLHFSGPDQQKVCTARSCANGSALPGAGTLASAKPGIRLVPSTLGPSATGPGGGHYAAGQVVINYHTTQRWSWGFDGQIIISGMSASLLGTWRLAFDYPGTRIVEVQGARWEPTGQDSGVAEASSSGPSGQDGGPQNGSAGGGGDHPGGSAGHGGQQDAVVITIEASGPPSGPSNCRFDNAPCTFR